MKLLIFIQIFVIINTTYSIDEYSTNWQCYRNFRTNDNSKKYLVNTWSIGSADSCISECINRYYKFVALRNGNMCYCMNTYEGEEAVLSECNLPCQENREQYCGGKDDSFYAIYETGLKVPGAPRYVFSETLTENTVKLRWQAPEYKNDVNGYVITAHVLHTYSSSVLNSLQWKVYNDTLHYDMYNLHPGSTYNFTVQASSIYGLGYPASVVAATLIGVPEPAPKAPEILNRELDRIIINIGDVRNDNGPISAYQIVVINQTEQGTYITEYLKSYSEAMKDGLPYYIAAELRPEQIEGVNFTVGDGKYYNNYYNVPLMGSGQTVDVALGVISRNGSRTKVRYTQSPSNRDGVIVLNIGTNYNQEIESNLNLGLTIAIIFLGILLVLSVFALYYLKRRIQLQQRATDSQELTLQGPILEMENSGYIPEEEVERVNHYDNLRSKVWNIPKNFLDIHSGNILGIGKYGRVVSGTVQRDSATVPVAIQIISDHTLQKNDAKSMLKQLNILIVAGVHSNLISLIGFYENPTTLYIVMENYDKIFKDWLLHGRVLNEDGTKFTPILQNDLLKYFIQIASGMTHLYKQRLVHGQLCCRNVLIDLQKANCKVTGIGLSDHGRNGVHLDYSRWQAHELFRQRQPSSKSDVWSFGCLMWEACALGGTPFAHILSKDVANEIRRGARLHQLNYITTDLYQIMMNCWQTDSDERPLFQEIIQNLEYLSNDCVPLMDFSVYSGFVYEKYCNDLEIQN